MPTQTKDKTMKKSDAAKINNVETDEINLRAFYGAVRAMTANTPLEQIAINAILDMFPAEPSRAYTDCENDAYAKAYDMMVPDQMMDWESYMETLDNSDIDDADLIRERGRLFDKLLAIAAELAI